MPLFHSTVSRRDFMRNLGLTGFGICVSSVAPVFHDLDEVAANNVSEKKPWWIKTRDTENPTVDIDWKTLNRFNPVEYNNFEKHITPEKVDKIFHDTNIKRQQELTLNTTPRFTLRDNALKLAGWYGVMLRNLVNPNAAKELIEGPPTVAIPSGLTVPQMNQPPEFFGAPRYEGTQEENTAMLRSALRLFGASSIAFVEITENTKKLLWTNQYEPPSPPYVFEEAEKPTYSPTKITIPNKSKWAVVFTVRQSLELFLSGGYLSDAAAGTAYDNTDIVRYRLQVFLNALGYHSISASPVGLGPKAAWGVMSGLGELGRLQHLVTPEWGPMVRESEMVIIDLPVISSKPIDFGASRFCETSCTKCADTCPGQALQKTKNPSWDITPAYDTVKPKLFNNPGLKTWYFDHLKCRTVWEETGTFCGWCNASCVFSKDNVASIHDIVKTTIAGTSVFNDFFFTMDQAFGYKMKNQDEAEKWWHEDIPVHGINY
ncbi:reductive dehalogenase [Dehalococcoides mccartyi]|jgi:reductive dehalogenase|uniref:reductive dehalogenase n=1 Tax=Dehalococcoides mccartyi TaxID=61435 RepID=UPI0003C835B8|nr:reductive dehalogenase [Dehalococcoides mccartyi]AHB12911.1 reductive dehalogenase [Dehalococcoides mccartyi GY50]